MAHRPELTINVRMTMQHINAVASKGGANEILYIL